MRTHSNITSANSDVSQEADICEVFKSRGYGVWIPLPEFPHQHEFNRAIHNLRKRDDLNIQNKTERASKKNGRPVTKSWYRLNPGSYAELCGKPEKESSGDTRHARAAQFERDSGLSRHPWKSAFSEKRLAEPTCFQLTPPEVRR